MRSFEALTTERLVIRTIRSDDAGDFFAYKSRPECGQYQFWRPKTPEEITAFIAKMAHVEPDTPGTWLQLAVCLKETGRMIGDVGLHFIEGEDRQVEIGYTVSPDHQGRGYATEAVRAVLDYLFFTLGKHRVTASIDPRNKPSAAVLERVGFRREAHFMKSVFVDGEWQDDWVYALLGEEWKGIRG